MFAPPYETIIFLYFSLLLATSIDLLFYENARNILQNKPGKNMGNMIFWYIIFQYFCLAFIVAFILNYILPNPEVQDL